MTGLLGSTRRGPILRRETGPVGETVRQPYSPAWLAHTAERANEKDKLPMWKTRYGCENSFARGISSR
jgi:hypothetical protein